MNFFISVDSYAHIPRLFFGLIKDKKAPTQQRPATITVFADNGRYKTFNFHSAKTKDDETWDGRIVNPADYGHYMMDNDIATTLNDWVEKQTHMMPIFYFIDELEEKVIIDFFKRTWGEVYPTVRQQMADYETETVIYADDEEFERECYTTAINKQEGQENYTTEEKLTMLYSHKRYPHLNGNHMSMDKAQETYSLYLLLQGIRKK